MRLLLAPPQWWREWDLTHYAALKAADHAQTHSFCDQLISRSYGWNVWLNAPHLPCISEVQATSNLRDCYKAIPVQEQCQHHHHEPLPRCPISQSSVTSVMSMFNFILILLCYDQISHPWRAMQANFRSHIVVRNICDIHVQLQSSMTSVISLFSCTLPFPHYYPISDFTHPPWHLWCQNAQFHPLLFSVIIKIPISAMRCRPISDLTQLSVTPVISMLSYIRLDIRVVYIRSHFTSSPLLPNFPTLQCIAGKFLISQRYLWYSYDVAFIHDIRDVMFSFHLTLPHYYSISDFTHPLWHPWCQWSTSSQLISIMIKSPIFAGVAESWLEHQISHLRSA